MNIDLNLGCDYRGEPSQVPNLNACERKTATEWANWNEPKGTQKIAHGMQQAIGCQLTFGANQ
jgi:hypothetical protein